VRGDGGRVSKESNARRMAEIERRLKAISLTSAPWSPTPDAGVRRGGVAVFHGRNHPEQADRDNADFAAEARQDVPWLVARVRQLESLLDGEGIIGFADPDPIDEE